MKKVILMVFLIFSLLMIVYGIGFILNYYLVIKYSIEDCLPLGGKGTFPVVSDRLDEIHALVNYAGKSSVSCPLKPSDSAPLKHSTMPP